jgi:hypothetical protein
MGQLFACSLEFYAFIRSLDKPNRIPTDLGQNMNLEKVHSVFKIQN